MFERIDDGKLSVCKVTFGAEPKDCEVWEFVLKNYGKRHIIISVFADFGFTILFFAERIECGSFLFAERIERGSFRFYVSERRR